MDLVTYDSIEWKIWKKGVRVIRSHACHIFQVPEDKKNDNEHLRFG